MPSAAVRSFVVGETVHFRVRINAPGTRRPADAENVVLTSVKRGTTTVTVATTVFTRLGEGDYTLTVPTVGLQVGTYDVVVKVDDGPAAVVLLPDRFVLRAA